MTKHYQGIRNVV